jgi:hypothetical protein
MFEKLPRELRDMVYDYAKPCGNLYPRKGEKSYSKIEQLVADNGDFRIEWTPT